MEHGNNEKKKCLRLYEELDDRDTCGDNKDRDFVLKQARTISPVDPSVDVSRSHDASSEKWVTKSKNKEQVTMQEKKIERQRVPSLDIIHVEHECFGKCWGKLDPELYESEESKCIKCSECCKCPILYKKYTRENKHEFYLAFLSNVKFHLCILAKHFSPREFILHLHPANRETQTCHWGFDVSNWRSYLHIQVCLNIKFF